MDARKTWFSVSLMSSLSLFWTCVVGRNDVTISSGRNESETKKYPSADEKTTNETATSTVANEIQMTKEKRTESDVSACPTEDRAVIPMLVICETWSLATHSRFQARLTISATEPSESGTGSGPSSSPGAYISHTCLACVSSSVMFTSVPKMSSSFSWVQFRAMVWTLV